VLSGTDVSDRGHVQCATLNMAEPTLDTPFEVPQVGQPSQTLANRTSTRGCRPNLIDICALAPSASVQIRAQVDAALEAIIRQCVQGHSSFLSAYGGKLVEGEVDDLVDEIAAAFQPAIVDASKTTLAAVIRTVVRYGCKLAAVMEEREVAAAFAPVVPPLAASVESTEKLNSEAIAVIGVEACMAVKTVYGITLRPNQRVSSAWVKKTRDSLVRGDLPAKSFVLEKLRLENNVMDDDHNEESFLRFTVKFHETKDHDITSPSDFFPLVSLVEVRHPDGRPLGSGPATHPPKCGNGRGVRRHAERQARVHGPELSRAVHVLDVHGGAPRRRGTHIPPRRGAQQGPRAVLDRRLQLRECAHPVD
jgi:hypothetical protein